MCPDGGVGRAHSLSSFSSHSSIANVPVQDMSRNSTPRSHHMFRQDTRRTPCVVCFHSPVESNHDHKTRSTRCLSYSSFLLFASFSTSNDFRFSSFARDHHLNHHQHERGGATSDHAVQANQADSESIESDYASALPPATPPPPPPTPTPPTPLPPSPQHFTSREGHVIPRTTASRWRGQARRSRGWRSRSASRSSFTRRTLWSTTSALFPTSTSVPWRRRGLLRAGCLAVCSRSCC